MFVGQGDFGQVFLCRNVLDWKAHVGFQGQCMHIRHAWARCAVVDAAACMTNIHGCVVRPLTRLHTRPTCTYAPCVC